MNILKSLLVLFIVLVSSSAFRQLQDDNPHGDIEIDCEECHNPTDWLRIQKSIRFNHDRTGFPLAGAHRQVKCRSCHESLIFHYIGTACIDCHLDIHKNELGFKCENCHTPEDWENRQEIFDQHTSSRFPLLGAHAITDCEACHYNQQRNEYKNTPLDCYICHHESYSSATNPDHQQAELGIGCENCHLPTATSWDQTIYQHTSLYVLQGGHVGVECKGCHSYGYKNTPSNCDFCHLEDYNATEDPNHIDYGFPTDCEVCHTEISWQNDSFDHVQASGFELRGVHNAIRCNACHVNNQLTGLSRVCYGCHEMEYNQVVNPNHITGHFPFDCLVCHNENTWSPADFDHNATNFPLTGAHQTINCDQCHTNGQYAGLASDCWSCHESDFISVTDPSHVENNFDHDCSMCHSTMTWIPAEFDHNETNFPLTGAHQTINCDQCHTNGQYAGLASDCWSCHESDFISVTDPSHVENNFDHDCSICHSTITWIPAEFDHNETNFPLTGAHLTLNCLECHSSGYDHTPMACFACHENDYNNTNDPNHITAGFPTSCEDCHNTSDWNQTTWDHDAQYFPIYSGAHQNAWNTCSECHVNISDYALFECIFCHEHSQVLMDEKHREENNYNYLSSACYECHPRGRAED